MPEGVVLPNQRRVQKNTQHARALSDAMGVKDGNIAGRQSKGEGEMTEKAIQHLQDHPSLLMEFDELQGVRQPTLCCESHLIHVPTAWLQGKRW